MKKLMIILFLFSSLLFAQTTYYVDWTNGNDANSGLTTALAWKSFNNLHSGTGFSAGDSILFKRGETWGRVTMGEGIYISLNGYVGTSGNEIVFGAYGTGTDPIWDCEGTIGLDETVHLFYMFNSSYVIFRDIKFTTSSYKDAGVLIILRSECTHITFRSCEFDVSMMRTTVPNVNYHEETLSADIDYLTVDSCYAHGSPPYNRHAFYSGGNYTVFTYNTVQGFGTSGLKLNAGVGPSCEYGIIAHNLIVDANVNIMIGEAKYSDIYSNVSIFTTSASPEANHVRFEENEGDSYVAPQYNKYYNNTCITNGSALGNMYFIRQRKSGGSYGAWDVFQNNDIKNNIFYIYNESSDYFSHLSTGSTYPVPEDYTLYYSDNLFRWKNDVTTYTSLSAWELSTNAPAGFNGNSFFADPEFVGHYPNDTNPADYRLQTTSPAIDKGVAVTFNNTITLTDYYNNPITGGVDIGAFQDTASAVPPDTIVPPPTGLTQELIISDSNRTFQYTYTDWTNNDTTTNSSVDISNAVLEVTPHIAYQADWSVGVDGWAGIYATVSGNNDAISDGTTSKNNVLKAYASIDSVAHYVWKDGYYVSGDTLRQIMDYYVPSAQSNVTGFRWTNNVGTVLSGSETYYDVSGSWAIADMTYIANAGVNHRIYERGAGGLSVFKGAGISTDDIIYIDSFTAYDWFVRSTSKIILPNTAINPVTSGDSYTLKLRAKSADGIQIKYGFGNMDTTVTLTSNQTMYSFSATYSGTDTESFFIQPLSVGFFEVDSVSFFGQGAVMNIKIYGINLNAIKSIYGIPVENYKKIMGIE